MENKETYQMKNYHGDSYDSKIPVELAEVFFKIKEAVEEASNGKYYCTPSAYYTDESEGITVGIIEVNDNSVNVKTPFTLTIKYSQVAEW